MKNYAEMKKSEKVQSVRFVGGGIAIVTLNSGFGNPNVGTKGQPSYYHSANQEFTAWCFDAAKNFVDGAHASRYGTYPGGGAGRVADGTPRSCNPHSELYWCM
jgi:hypothetical protein